MIAKWDLPWTFRLLALMTLVLGVVSHSQSRSLQDVHSVDGSACLIGFKDRLHRTEVGCYSFGRRERNVQVVPLHSIARCLLRGFIPVLHPTICESAALPPRCAKD